MEESQRRWDLRTFSLPLRLDSSPAEKLHRTKACLFRAFSLHTTVAFTGAGCSAYHYKEHPLWRDFVGGLLSKTREVFEARTQATDLDRDEVRRQLDRYSTRLDSENDLDSPGLMHMAGYCRSVLRKLKSDGAAMESFLEDMFDNPMRLDSGVQKAPYRALLDLPIKRFITTNYDRVLEEILEKDGRPYLSITQEAKFTQEQAVFPLSNYRATRESTAIFHCHGVYDRPKSIIASEEDFQHWYLERQNPQGECLRQCLDLTLGSNPILFVGYGLRDEDLLRPLRLLNAMSPGNRLTKPLFALLPGSDLPAWPAKFDYLYSRWGVHVIPYEVDDGASSDAHSQALHDELCRLRRQWHEWHEEWARKPCVRSGEVRQVAADGQARREYYHFYPDLGAENWTRRLPTLKRVWKAVNDQVFSNGGGTGDRERVPLTFLHGPSGSGKSYTAWRLLEECPAQHGRFYWSSYYDRDWLNGFKAAADFLAPGREISESLVESFRHGLLQAEPSVLVFDGFERLLTESAGGHSEPINQTVRRILQLICEEEHEVRVLVCSTVVPEEFASYPSVRSAPVWRQGDGIGEPETERPCAQVEAPRLVAHDYRKLEWCSQDRFAEYLPALSSLLQGHVYATYLLESLIRVSETNGGAGTEERLRKLIRRLAGVSQDRRIDSLIRFVVEFADESDRCHAAGGLLERLSLFHKPPPLEVAETAYRATRLGEEKEEVPEILSDDCENLLDLLRDLGLLFVVRSESKTGRERFLVHEAVRMNVFRDRFLAKSRPLPVFPFATFAFSIPAASHPGSEKAEETLEELFEILIRQADDPADQDDERRRLFTQYAYSLVRSCMDANAATRWRPLGTYNNFSLRVVAAAKHCAPDTWAFAPAGAGVEVEHPEAPLNAEELSWLYNDIGLALFTRGDLRDAQAIFDQAETIRQLIRPFTEERFYEIQSLLQYGHLLIDRGRLLQAGKVLEKSLKLSKVYEHDECVARAYGHLALISNLRGDYNESLNRFDECLERLESTNNLRGRSHFLRLKADLLMRQGEDDDAHEALELALSIANSGDYPDLVYSARHSLGRYYRRQKDYVRARREYEAARDFAVAKEVNQLEAHVLRELARLSLDLGDFENARHLAKRSLRLANDLSLALQQAHSLFVLGLANTRGPSHELGLAQIRFARELSQERQYWSLDRLIEETLADENLRIDDQPLDLATVGSRSGRK